MLEYTISVLIVFMIILFIRLLYEDIETRTINREGFAGSDQKSNVSSNQVTANIPEMMYGDVPLTVLADGDGRSVEVGDGVYIVDSRTYRKTTNTPVEAQFW